MDRQSEVARTREENKTPIIFYIALLTCCSERAALGPGENVQHTPLHPGWRAFKLTLDKAVACGCGEYTAQIAVLQRQNRFRTDIARAGLLPQRTSDRIGSQVEHEAQLGIHSGFPQHIGDQCF